MIAHMTAVRSSLSNKLKKSIDETRLMIKWAIVMLPKFDTKCKQVPLWNSLIGVVMSKPLAVKAIANCFFFKYFLPFDGPHRPLSASLTNDFGHAIDIVFGNCIEHILVRVGATFGERKTILCAHQYRLDAVGYKTLDFQQIAFLA